MTPEPYAGRAAEAAKAARARIIARMSSPPKIMRSKNGGFRIRYNTVHGYEWSPEVYAFRSGARAALDGNCESQHESCP